MRTWLLPALNTFGLLAVLLTNTLANALPINGYTTGALSALYPNLFVPAGFTFSIWGLIYAFLIAFVAWQWWAYRRQEELPGAVRLIGLWFFLSCAANVGWILAWHHRLPGLSLAIMGFLLLTLIQIYRNLGPGLRPVSSLEKWCVQAPYSLYLGWISVALIANAAALLTHLGWQGGGLPQPFWAAGMLLVAGLLGLLFLSRRFDWVYAGVIIWACAGVFYRHQVLLDGRYNAVLTAAAAVAVLLIYRIARSARHFEGPRAY